jgi:thiopeptide-type bacteriocin biosynthesis protein
VPSGGFHLRTPLLSFDLFLSWGSDLTATCVPAERLEAALKEDRAIQRQRLRAIVESRDMREAIFVASPELDAAVENWLTEPESKRGQRVERALVKYFSRAAGRATPFGLFAGTSVGRIGDTTDLILDARDRSVRHSRLDIDYLFALSSAIAQDPTHRDGFTLKPNSSLYERAGQLRFVEVRVAEEKRTYHLVAAETSDALLKTLARARGGASTADLISELVAPDVSTADASGFVSELIDSQILVPDLGLAVTGSEPTRAFAARLSASGSTCAIADALRHVDSALAAIDKEGLGVEPSRYRAIAAALDGLPEKADITRLFQVDLVKQSAAAMVGGAVLEELTAAVDLLHRLLPQTTDSDLAVFKDAFRERYEASEVRLTDVLDEESGIGFPAYRADTSDGSPLLADLPPPPETMPTVVWDARERRLLDRLAFALRSGRSEIELDDSDVGALSHPSPPPLPAAIAVTAQLAAASTAAFARGDFRLLVTAVTGASGATVLGRFCHADPDVLRMVERHLRAEEALLPDAVFAEVVHLPEDRIGNVVLRPVLRDFEIEFMGQSGATSQRRIPVTDLLVSLKGDSLHLRSERLGRRVVPRLTTAHNHSLSGLGVYRFLCALQSDGTAGRIGWSWNPFGGAPFLPRVTHGRLVLGPATWNVTRDELLLLRCDTAASRFEAVQSLRAARGLPRFVVVRDEDNTLPVDLDAALSVESFAHLVKGRDNARLEEMFPAADELCARGPDGRYVHEIVVPLVRSAAPQRETPAVHVAPAVTRSFSPGSEWLYAKLYTGTATADRVLVESVAPLAGRAIASGAADCWFFIRYADPREHVRVRFHGDPDRLRNEVLPPLLAIGSRELASGNVWKVQLETYEREIERYGGPAGIELAEQVFWADSEAVLQIIQLLEPGDAGHDDRWRMCLLGLDTLLSDFGFTLEQKHEMIARARRAYGIEQGEDAALRRALGERHRLVGRGVRSLLSGTLDDDHPLAAGVAVLRERSARMAPIVAQLQARERDGRLSTALDALAHSLLHMHAVRMLRAAARRNEIVLYELLMRFYRTRLSGSIEIAT